MRCSWWKIRTCWKSSITLRLFHLSRNSSLSITQDGKEHTIHLLDKRIQGGQVKLIILGEASKHWARFILRGCRFIVDQDENKLSIWLCVAYLKCHQDANIRHSLFTTPAFADELQRLSCDLTATVKRSTRGIQPVTKKVKRQFCTRRDRRPCHVLLLPTAIGGVMERWASSRKTPSPQ